MLQITKFEMHSGADRNTFGNAAYTVCKTAKSTSGVNDAKYYWVNPNLIAFIVDAEPGSWGSGAQPTSEAMKALFDLSDIFGFDRKVITPDIVNTEAVFVTGRSLDNTNVEVTMNITYVEQL